MINIPMNTGISGEYRLVVNRANGVKHDTGWFKNLILDQGLERIGTVNPTDFRNLLKFVKLGTGTTPPEVSQTALETQIAVQQSTSTTTTNLGSPSYIGRCEVKYTFGLGAILNTITEIGVGWESGTGSLFSRALITPGPLTLGALDQLEVFYRLEFTPSLNDVNGTFSIGSTSYNYTIRRAEIDQYSPGDDSSLISGRNSSLAIYENFVLGSITESPTGTVKATDAPSLTAYVPNSYYIEAKFDFAIAITVSTGNGGLLYRVSTAGFDYGAFQISYAPPITKTTAQILSFVIRNSWARL